MNNTRGFTLAEALLAVAITLILCLIAMPAIGFVQANMRMADLNQAAESVANAAQTSMSAKKASGTWLSLCDTVKPNSAKGAGADADTYYFTVDQARDAGIVTSLGVEERAAKSDYVIEFKKSTASVQAVLLTDGKNGFFDFSEISTTGALGYYLAGGSRNQEARKANKPMIGLYEGTPASATSAVALANPVIWVSETGLLCIQNPSLGDARAPEVARSTVLEVTLSAKDAETGKVSEFTIGGLNSAGQGYTVKTPATQATSFSNAENETRIFTMTTRGLQSTSSDVFQIDLGRLKDILDESQDQALKTAIDAVAEAKDVRVKARVSAADEKAAVVPATGEANITWPNVAPAVSVLVTNPDLSAKDNEGRSRVAYINGTFADPSVKLLTQDGDAPATGLAMTSKEEIFGLLDAGYTTPQQLIQENVEEARQSYTGGSVKVADIQAQTDPDKGVYLYAAVQAGAYNSSYAEKAGTDHKYQITEIWVNGQRAGWLGIDMGQAGKPAVWHWGQTDLAWAVSNCVDSFDPVNGSLNLNLRSLIDSGIASEPTGYSVYVRTAPKTEEVHSFFQSNTQLLARVVNSLSGTAGSVDARDASNVALRQAFENEFGAPSTVCMYNVVGGAQAADANPYETVSVPATGFTLNSKGERSYFQRGDARVYYTPTPALAFNKGEDAALARVCTALPNTKLWAFKVVGGQFDEQPEATVIPSRLGVAYNYAMGKTDAGAFFLPENRDGLFYRVVEYCDENGKPIEIAQTQGASVSMAYVPYDNQRPGLSDTYPVDKNNATAPVKDGYKFTYWRVVQINAESPAEFTVAGNETLGVYSNYYGISLKLGYIRLVAQYEKLPDPPKPVEHGSGVGLMYLEFGSDGSVGYSGYAGKDEYGQDIAAEHYLPNETPIDSWGYYFTLPEGSRQEIKFQGKDWTYGSRKTLTMNGQRFWVWPVVPLVDEDAVLRSQYVEIGLVTKGDANNTYYANFNFAGTVEVDPTKADAWGTTEETAWNVRHADQFPGHLRDSKGVTSVDVQQTYAGDCFIQTHDLDFASRTLATDRYDDVVLANNVQFAGNTAFSGTYDGGNFAILNSHANAPYMLYNQGSGTDKFGNRNLSGISYVFPRVEGHEGNPDNPIDPSNPEKLAVLKNIRIVEDYSDLPDSTCDAPAVDKDGVLVDDYSNFGLLAGVAENAVIENCSIEGIGAIVDEGTGEREVAKLVSTHGSGDMHGFGTFVGAAANAEIKGASLKNLQVTIKVDNGETGTQAVTTWKGATAFGGIVGIANDTVVDSCTVKDAGFGTASDLADPAEPDASLAIGGIVGSFNAIYSEDAFRAPTVKNCAVENTLLFAKAQNAVFEDADPQDPQKPKNTEVCAIIAKAGATLENNTFAVGTVKRVTADDTQSNVLKASPESDPVEDPDKPAADTNGPADPADPNSPADPADPNNPDAPAADPNNPADPNGPSAGGSDTGTEGGEAGGSAVETSGSEGAGTNAVEIAATEPQALDPALSETGGAQ